MNKMINLILVCGIIMCVHGHRHRAHTSPETVGTRLTTRPDFINDEIENGDLENDNKNDNGRIRYGWETDITEFPFMAQILYRSITLFKKNHEGLCSGALISYKHVLSAAHCAPKPDSYGFFGVERRGYIFVGSNLLAFWNSEPSSIIKKYFVHPKYERPSYDVAVFLSDRDLSSIPNAKPISLPSDGESIKDVQGFFFTAGWGLTEKNKLPEKLKFINITLSTSEDCHNNALWYNKINWNHHTMVCTMKAAVCYGDSGGPVFTGNPPTVWAVTSFVNSPDCSMPPSFMARVDTSIDFIKATMST